MSRTKTPRTPPARRIHPSKRPGKTAKSNWLCLVGLASLVLITYINSLDTSWHFDDLQNIVHNPDIRMQEFNWASLKTATISRAGMTRPVSYLTFALNFYMRGLDVTSFHWTNILIHALNACLVFFLLWQLTAHWDSDVSEGHRRIFSFWVAAFWAVHPIQTQTVTYIVQRMALLSTLFLLLSFGLYLKGKSASRRKQQWTYWAGAGFAALLSFASKENGFILPVLILVFELTELVRLGQFRKLLQWTFGGAISLLLMGGLLAWKYHLPGIIQQGYQGRDFTMVERLMTEPRVVVFYLSQVLWPLPSRLALHHEFPLSHSLLNPPTTLYALILIASLIAFAVWLLRRHPMFSFFIFWYFLNLLIESTVLPLELIFEHRVYLPSVGMAATLVYPFWEFSRQLRQKKIWSGVLALWVFWGALCINWSWQRNDVWKDEITLWEDNARKYPQSDRVQNNLATAYESVGNFPRAELAYQEAVQVNPRSAVARANLALFYLNRGRREDAVQTLSGVPPAQMNGIAYYAWAAIEANRGDWEKAIPMLREALSRTSFFPEAQYQLGIAYVKTGQPDLARKALQEYLQIIRGEAMTPQANRARLELQLLDSDTKRTP